MFLEFIFKHSKYHNHVPRATHVPVLIEAQARRKKFDSSQTKRKGVYLMPNKTRAEREHSDPSFPLSLPRTKPKRKTTISYSSLCSRPSRNMLANNMPLRSLSQHSLIRHPAE
jgi:hypothetical protein